MAGQAHPAALPDVTPVPMRQADVQSLADALAAALAAKTLDPLWQQVLTAAGQEL